MQPTPENVLLNSNVSGAAELSRSAFIFHDAGVMKNQNTLTLKTKPTKTLFYLLGSLIFVVIGVLTLEGTFVHWLIIGFFGLGSIVFALLLLPTASYLRLTPEGFTMCSLFRSHSYNWSEIEDFAVGKMANMETVIFDHSLFYKNQNTLRKTNKKFFGFEAGLPDTYGMSAEELANLMNEWKRRFA
ncbi:MAG: hypothetical protein M3388_17075 [Acidobacteriota bacterium]|nr:hypothetical protein [Acidobacteriota bacterium]